MSPNEREALINRDHMDLSLTSQCKLLKISPSSPYYAPVGVNAELKVPVARRYARALQAGGWHGWFSDCIVINKSGATLAGLQYLKVIRKFTGVERGVGIVQSKHLN